MDWKTHEKQLLKNPKLRKALKEHELEFEVAKMVIEARIKLDLSQKQLAERLGTKQSVISRLENAKTVPSLSFLRRLAKALETDLVVRIGA